nr:DUF4219 domain-containing protein/UBN2 domain-containing protein [Tanacetum cinerariifolium]
VNHLLAHEIHQEEHLDFDVELDIDDNTILYHQHQLDTEVQDVPTEVSSMSPGEISVITILDDLRNQLDRHLKVNQEQSMVNDSLRAELARCSSNPWYAKYAKIAQPTLYDGHALLKPTNTHVRVHDDEESLVHVEVSRTKMSNRPGTIKPVNYAELNALYSYFVPQKELSREHVYWLPAEELATQKSNPPKHVTPFVHTRPASSKTNDVPLYRKTILIYRLNLETKLTQLKDAITSVRIQNDGFKVENVNLKRRYQELSTSNSHSRDTLTRKLTALTSENAKLKSKSLSKMHSEPIVPEKPKVLAPGMYAIRVKPATRASKPMSKSDTRNHSTLSTKREKARRVEDHHRNLNKQNHVDSHLNVKLTGFVSNSNIICNACNESLVFANHDTCVVSVEAHWATFHMYDKYPLTRIVEPIVEPLELTSCTSSNSKVTMISRFTDYKLSNRKAGSKGISASIQESGTSVLEYLKALSWKTCQEGSSNESIESQTYIKFKDIDLWKIIQNGNFYFEIEDLERKMMKKTPYELLKEDQKKQLGKNNEAKITLYNALPHREYERVFICETTKEIWHTFIITHQGYVQVKNCKINLLTQESEKFSISNEETIDSGFTRFNTILTSLKSLDLDYSSKNYVKKFLRTLPLKWRAKVTAIKESKDLSTLPLDNLVGNLKVYETILENDGIVSKTITKEKVKPLALIAKVTKEQTSDDG